MWLPCFVIRWELSFEVGVSFDETAMRSKDTLTLTFKCGDFVESL